MSNVAHASLTDPNLHETKGAAAATADQLLVAGGAGTATFKTRVFKKTATLSPALVAANTSAEQTFAVSGVVLSTDHIIGVEKPTAQAGLGIVGCRVTADNTIGITFGNFTAGGITPTASQTYTFILWRD